MKKNFKGQLDNEIVLAYFRKHWISILPRLLTLPGLMLAMGLGLRHFKFLTEQSGLSALLVIFGIVLLTYLIHRQFMAIFYFYLHTVLVTNFRIVEVDRSVYFRDSKNSVDLSKIQDIQKKQNGILENVLNFGTLTIVLSGTHVSVNIDLVPQPDYQFKKIHAVKQAQQDRGYERGQETRSIDPIQLEFARPIPVE